MYLPTKSLTFFPMFSCCFSFFLLIFCGCKGNDIRKMAFPQTKTPFVPYGSVRDKGVILLCGTTLICQHNADHSVHVQQRAARDNGACRSRLLGRTPPIQPESSERIFPRTPCTALHQPAALCSIPFRVLFLVIAVIFLVTWSILPCKGKVNRMRPSDFFHAVHFRVKVVHAAKPPTHNGQTALLFLRFIRLWLFVSSMCTYSAQASQSRAAALSFGIRLLARPTPRQPALRNSGMFSGVKQCSFPGLWQKRIRPLPPGRDESSLTSARMVSVLGDRWEVMENAKQGIGDLGENLEKAFHEHLLSGCRSGQHVGDGQADSRAVSNCEQHCDEQCDEWPHFLEQIGELDLCNSGCDVQGNANGRSDAAQNEGEHHDHAEVDAVDAGSCGDGG